VTTALATEQRVAHARRGLVIYMAATVVLAGLVTWRLLAAGDAIEHHPGLVALLMWAPAAAAFVARVLAKDGIGDVSFRLPARGRRRELLLAWLWPLGVGCSAYGLAWLSGLESFEPHASAFGHVVTPPVAFVSSIGVSLTIATAFGFVFALGEELGWRGYMLTRLIDARVPRPVLVSGLIWWLYHLPVILSGQYAAGRHPALSALVFGVSVTAAAFFVARVRLASGSIWPAVLFHAAWNATIQGTFDRFTHGGDPSHGTTLWTGEGGILVAAASVLGALLVYIRPIPIRRAPADAGDESITLRTA
jgi:membrane protease YdiL (CAAX protease family)